MLKELESGIAENDGPKALCFGAMLNVVCKTLRYGVTKFNDLERREQLVELLEKVESWFAAKMQPCCGRLSSLDHKEPYCGASKLGTAKTCLRRLVLHCNFNSWNGSLWIQFTMIHC